MAIIKLIPGDRVTIYRKVKSYYWIDKMDKLVGDSGTVVKVDYDTIKDDPTISVVLDNNKHWLYFPAASLKHEK